MRHTIFRGNTLAVAIGILVSCSLLLFIEGVSYLLIQFNIRPTLLNPNMEIHSLSPAHPLLVYEPKYSHPVSWAFRQKLRERPVWLGGDLAETENSLIQTGFFFASDYTFSPNSQARNVVKSKTDHQVIYDVTYNIDEYGHRSTPVSSLSDRSQHLILLGGSFTFGQGVNDNETLAAVLASEAKTSHPYNLGYMGGSPSTMIHSDQHNKLWTGIREPTGIALYLFIDDHVNRVIGDMQSLATWSDHLPYIKQDEAGVFKSQGSFVESRPILVSAYRFIHSLNFISLFNINIPFRFSAHHYDQFAQSVLQIKNSYLARFPGQQFYVLFYPSNSATRAPYLIKYLENMAIEYLDYSQFEMGLYTNEALFYQYDHHPKSIANSILGNQIARDLNLK